jgi:hypothetical protein
MKAYRLESCAASSAYAWKITYVTEDLGLMKTIYQRFHCPCTHILVEKDDDSQIYSIYVMRFSFSYPSTPLLSYKIRIVT